MIVLQGNNTKPELPPKQSYKALLQDTVKLIERGSKEELQKNEQELSAFFVNLLQKTNKLGLHDNYIKDDGKTEYSLLILAIEKDLKEFTLMLLSQGADVNQVMRDGKTALHVIVSKDIQRSETYIIQLLSRGAYKIIDTVWMNGVQNNTPLSCALGIDQSDIRESQSVARELLRAGANRKMTNTHSLFDAKAHSQLTLPSRRQRERTIKTWKSMLSIEPYLQRGYLQAIMNLIEKTYFDQEKSHPKTDLFLHHNTLKLTSIRESQVEKATELLYGHVPIKQNVEAFDDYCCIKQTMSLRLHYYQSNPAAEIEVYIDALLKFYELKAFLVKERIDERFNHIKGLVLQYIPMGEYSLALAKTDTKKKAEGTQSSCIPAEACGPAQSLSVETFSFGSFDPHLSLDHLMQLPCWKGKAQGFSQGFNARNPYSPDKNPYHPDKVAALESELIKLKFQQIDTWLQACTTKRPEFTHKQGGLALYLAEPNYVLNNKHHASYIDNGINEDEAESINIKSMTEQFSKMKKKLLRV